MSQRWMLKLTTGLYRKQITLKAAKLDALRMGFDIKAQSAEQFVRELAKSL